MSSFTPPPPDPTQRSEIAPWAGLCATCRHLQVLTSRRSVFVRCGLSDRDPRWPRYPGLPMIHCSGHEAC